MPLKVMSIVGARPQFIKAATVSRAMAARNDMAEILVHTGQHPDDNMSKVFFDELEVPRPVHELNIHGGGHGDATGRMLAALESIMLEEQPDWVVVYGDTNSTLAGALAAAKLHLPIMHVEAGLRSFNRRMPEEINRVIADHLSRLLMCPTRHAIANLEREGIANGVHHVGDVMYATLFAVERAQKRSSILEKLGLASGSYAVATIHRAETTDDPCKLRSVMNWLSAKAEDHTVVLPMHPRTRDALRKAQIEPDKLLVIDPVGHLDMTNLLDRCLAVYTDSGGLQKEAYFHRKPCVTLRGETEWLELVESGWNRLWTEPEYRPRRTVDEYGRGDAAQAILEHLAAADLSANRIG
jgi:UDP-GlcNAc3NAcA epimerase